MDGLGQYTIRELAEELFSRTELSDILFKFVEDEEVIEYAINYTDKGVLAKEVVTRIGIPLILESFASDEEIIEYVRNYIYVDADIIEARGMLNRKKLDIVLAALEIKQAYPDREDVFNELIKIGL